MRLTRLEMQGFKSFADQTALHFDQGVTAIVGPNGCGKSNVSDAVRWVLGEQRARILRGAKMEEVIFQGSSARRAVNIAEVSLVFENEDGQLPVAFREVVVTRRLSRSGESDYLLNGAACRLRDIHDLLRGTGLGADAGVVIEQRMIDALLSDRPDDRRELFEEAAGVGLYRDRRRSTERRLQETAQDLARIDDVVLEVQSQVRSLARQRKRAERHAALQGRRFSVELTLASRDMTSWQEELAELERSLDVMRQRAPALTQAVADAEAARDTAHARRAATESRRNEAARETAARRDGVQALRAEIAVSEERHRNALERRRRAEDERREGSTAEERLQYDRATAAGERQRLAEAQDQEEAQVRQFADAEARSREDVVLARTAVDDGEREARGLRDRLRELEIDRESAEREIRDLESRSRTLDVERGELADASGALSRELESARDAVTAAHTAALEAARRLEQARAGARLARDADVEARAELARADDRCTTLQGRVHALEGLERERVGLAPAAAHLLRERERFGEGAIIGPLSDFVNSSEASALAVERYLGMTLHAVLIRDTGVATAIREWHAATNPGPLLLLPLDAARATAGEAAGDLLSLVETAPEAAGWTRVLLERVRGQPDGSYVDGRGAIWLPGAPAGPGPLRRRAELSALRVELKEAESVRAGAAAEANSARESLLSREGAVSAATDAAAVAQDAERKALEVVAELEHRKSRYERELDDSRELAARLSHRAEELEAGIREIREQHAATAASVHGQDARVGAARDALAATERALDAARETRAAAQVQLAQAQVRLQVAIDREQRLEAERQTASRRLASLDEELAALEASDGLLSRQMAEWHADLEARTAALTTAEEELATAERSVLEAEAAFDTAEHALDAARREGYQHGEALHHAELRFTELAGRRAAIRERLEAEWHRPLDDMLAAFEPVDLPEEALRGEAEQMRQQLESLGPVNPLAIEEHAEEVKRLEFLTSQRNDLNEARNALQLAIREIDTTARALFLSTFEQVRENFRHIFMTLFGGGECDLRLENPEAPLDCDIEIHASPRGKRTQRIHLLSSGERALVALSLLFGIFLTKPSPFCLLDEVDAPLDDANIGRFVRMLNEFKRKTQFIVITHNPRTTTEAADVVYGITMQEPGVSTVVGVRMRGTPIDEVVIDGEPAVDKAVPVVPVNEAIGASL